VQPADELPTELIDALKQPAAYPLDASAGAGIETIQTHISYLFLTSDRVYKLRKSIALPFLSFATRAERTADCLREVSLNRRLAPDVYLGVAPVACDERGEWRVGAPSETLATAPGAGETFEHCVVMRRLSAGRDAESLLAGGVLAPAHIDALASMLAAFHDRADVAVAQPAPAAWLAELARLVGDSVALALDSGCGELDAAQLARDRDRLLDVLAARRTLFERRIEQRRLVDGHGDLRLEHVYFERDDTDPIAIDCVEFDSVLRRVDCAAEIAFLAMDLEYRGRRDLSERLLARYAEARDDFDLYGVIDFHIAHRALVRTGVAAVGAMEEEIGPAGRRAAAGSAAAHARLAHEVMGRPKEPVVVLTCGMVGTGKSSVAAAIRDRLGGAVVASDRTRKHLAGLPPSTRASAAPGEGIYSEEFTHRVYAGVLQRAEPVIGSGRAVVLDATWSRKAWRHQARVWAEANEQRPLLVEVCCARETIRARLARRERDPERVSDAGPDFLAVSARSFEAPDEWPESDHLVVWTDRADWREGVGDAVQDWIGRTSRSGGADPGALGSV
jgi:aminoglycoside phosphotransferase family enzyme/predicted kinase